MKMTQSAKLFTGLGLIASLFWGCQDLLSQKDGSALEPEAITTDGTALRLSIKDDSACRDQWNTILDARAVGLADTSAEKSFLAHCVTEMKPGKDKLPPLIPPHLQPDSISRCHWIVSQIEGGRDEMTVSYKRYCPDDCRRLEDKDSTRHDHLCRDPHGPVIDTAKHPRPPMDTTRPPIDTSKHPGNPLEDTCKAARDSIVGLDTASAKYRTLRLFLLARCGIPPLPHDTLPKPPIDTTKPPIDTAKHPRNPLEDSCKAARDSIAGLDTASAKYRSLRQYLLAHCGIPPIPPIPRDTLPKPIPVKPVVICDELRAKLLKLDAASEGSKLLEKSIHLYCPEAKP